MSLRRYAQRRAMPICFRAIATMKNGTAMETTCPSSDNLRQMAARFNGERGASDDLFYAAFNWCHKRRFWMVARLILSLSIKGPPEVDVKSQLSQPSLWSRQNVDNPQEREAARQRMCKGLDRALSSPLSSIFD